MTAFACHVYDALAGEHPVSGIDRYRVALAHIAAHRRWSQPLVADNLSPLQRLTIECLETPAWITCCCAITRAYSRCC